jgi:DNA-directed RNA polymerase specialized sigma subunit
LVRSWNDEMRNVSRAKARARLVLGYVPQRVALSDRHKAVLEARYVRRLNWQDIAKELGTSYTSVRRWNDELLDMMSDAA